jgi:ATP-dependent exoDNAse (exonuclease V) beta subunit
MHSSKGLEYPVVIVDDMSALFKGSDHEDVMMEEKYGLAPRAYDDKKMLKSSTLLRRLCEKRDVESSVADELNLYYVALTRAKYSLHMVFKERSVLPDVRYARSFAEFTDFSVWEKYVVQDEIFHLPKQERVGLPFHPDEALARQIIQAFLWEYPHTGAENLPVKSSATKLLGGQTPVMETDEPNADTLYEIAEEGGQTSADAGTACHAFLEQFDFSLLYDEHGAPVSRETLRERVVAVYEKAEQSNSIENLHLLTKEKLTDVLSNDVFYRLQNHALYKEQQFLVSLPVKDTLGKYGETHADVSACEDEETIFQGAIDLLAVSEESAWIIDYKYSVKDANSLLDHYRPQLELYRMAVAKILHIPLKNIRCTIVNVYHGFQVDVD